MGNQKGSIKDLIRAKIRYLMSRKKKKPKKKRKVTKIVFLFFMVFLQGGFSKSTKTKKKKESITKKTPAKVINAIDPNIDMYLDELEKIYVQLKTTDSLNIKKSKEDYEKVLYQINKNRYHHHQKIQEKISKIDTIIENQNENKEELKIQEKRLISNVQLEEMVKLENKNLITKTVVYKEMSKVGVIARTGNELELEQTFANKETQKKNKTDELQKNEKKEEKNHVVEFKKIQEKISYIEEYIDETIQKEEPIEPIVEATIEQELKLIEATLIVLASSTPIEEMNELQNTIKECEEKLTNIIKKQPEDKEKKQPKKVEQEFSLEKSEIERINLLFKEQLLEINHEFHYLKHNGKEKKKKKYSFLNKLAFKIRLLSLTVFTIRITKNKWINKLLGTTMIYNKIKTFNNILKEDEHYDVITFQEALENVSHKKSCIQKTYAILDASYLELVDIKSRLTIEYQITRNPEILTILENIQSVEFMISEKRNVLEQQHTSLLSFRKKIKKKM